MLKVLNNFCYECPFKTQKRRNFKDHMKKKHDKDDIDLLRIGCNFCKEGEVHENCSVASLWFT